MARTPYFAMVVDLDACTGCKKCMTACASENQTPAWRNTGHIYVEDVERQHPDHIEHSFFPHFCNHCDNPPCMEVCPTGAIHKLDNGLVLIDNDLCMAPRACRMACPYDAIHAITYEDIEQGKKLYGESYRHTKPSSDKCSFCAHRVLEGKQPACVEACDASALTFGNLNDPQDKVAQLVDSGEARPLMPHLGTKPNVYYIRAPSR